MAAIAFVLGVLINHPHRRRDMPVVISMLNSYSGWPRRASGSLLNNTMLIIAGSRSVLPALSFPTSCARR